jgi:hypothetical protein
MNGCLNGHEMDGWKYAFEIGMFATIALFALQAFKNFNIYKYYYRSWLGIIVLLFLNEFLIGHRILYALFYIESSDAFLYFISVVIICTLHNTICASLVYLVAIVPATYQYRKKAGILRRADTPLFCAAIILCGFYIYNGIFILEYQPLLKHLLEP